jgi:DNA-binding XRE family transcriptional regulator
MKSSELRKIRERLNLTQGEFAEKIGASRQTVNRWESDDIESCVMLPVYERAIRELAKNKGAA